MSKPKAKKLHKNILVAYQRLVERGGMLCRQFSESEEARSCGGNYIYFTVKDNQKFPTGAGRFFVEKEIVKSSADGLFADTPQTFAAVSRTEFERFKNDYEQMQVRVG